MCPSVWLFHFLLTGIHLLMFCISCGKLPLSFVKLPCSENAHNSLPSLGYALLSFESYGANLLGDI